MPRGPCASGSKRCLLPERAPPDEALPSRQSGAQPASSREAFEGPAEGKAPLEISK